VTLAGFSDSVDVLWFSYNTQRIPVAIKLIGLPVF